MNKTPTVWPWIVGVIIIIAIAGYWMWSASQAPVYPVTTQDNTQQTQSTNYTPVATTTTTTSAITTP